MKKPRTLLLTLLFLLLIVGIPAGFFAREYRREQASRELIAAIKEHNTEKALATLQAGADPNARDHSDEKPPTVGDQFRRLFAKLVPSHTSTEPDTRPVALLVLLRLEDTYDDPRPPSDNPEIAKALLDHGADINAKDEIGYTALVRAAYDGKYKILRLLAKRGGTGTFDEDSGSVTLNRAIDEGDCEDVRILLGQKIPVDTRYGRMTLLMLACSKGKKDVVRLLLQRHADVNALGYGETALSLAEKKGDKEIIQLLKQAGGKTGEELEAEAKRGMGRR